MLCGGCSFEFPGLTAASGPDDPVLGQKCKNLVDKSEAEKEIIRVSFN
jgi:hypothetical protein